MMCVNGLLPHPFWCARQLQWDIPIVIFAKLAGTLLNRLYIIGPQQEIQIEAILGAGIKEQSMHSESSSESGDYTPPSIK